jgi:predicted ATPase/class 3 adenylate cyclase
VLEIVDALLNQVGARKTVDRHAEDDIPALAAVLGRSQDGEVRELPTGTVTLLFTDIEGSTRLLRELGDGYADVLAEHRRVLRKAFRSHGGVEVDTQGDAFFYSFTNANDAVAAAREGQRALSGGPVTVRIGLHTGEPAVTEEGYVGADVHCAARIMSAGHGGQILLSQTTRDELDAAVELRDLGEHRLKDIEGPVWIYQLGKDEFPPLKAISNTNLPRPVSSFVGRQRELEDVLALLRRESVRLLTLTGPGGSGKTRLAIEAAAELVGEYPNGVFWVGLAALRDPALVTTTIAQTLGAKDGLEAHISERELLLVLDNLEQVVEAAAELSAVLERCPNLTILTTSRELLRVRGEVEYEVPPLAQPEAVELFCERARVEPSPEIEELCARLDNLPLAVELAAARAKALSPAQILERLSQRLDLLKGGRDADPRQQTLRAAIEWSHDLLTEEEQALFRRLSVFAGGCTLESAEDVADADLDTLQSLVEKSLVRRTGERYWLLETIREYAVERLEESGETDERRRAHAAHYARLADGLWSALVRGERESWRIAEDEQDNFHTALEFSLSWASGNALVLAGQLWPFWAARGYVRQGRHWVERALALPNREGKAARAYALVSLGQLTKVQGDFQTAVCASEEALRCFQELNEPIRASGLLIELADFALASGESGRARTLAEEGLAIRRELEYDYGIARALLTLGGVELAGGNPLRAGTLFEEALERLLEEAPEGANTGHALEALGEVARRSGDDEQASSRFAEGLRLFARIGDEAGAAECLEGLACVATNRADHERAASLAGAAEALRERSALARDRPERPLPDHVEPAWSEGRAMTLDEAVDLALESID